MGRRQARLDPENPLHAFAIELRELRDRAGSPASQKATFDRTGINRSTYYAWLSGKQLPGRYNLWLLVEAWGGEPEYWLSRRSEVEAELGRVRDAVEVAAELGAVIDVQDVDSELVATDGIPLGEFRDAEERWLKAEMAWRREATRVFSIDAEGVERVRDQVGLPVQLVRSILHPEFDYRGSGLLHVVVQVRLEAIRVTRTTSDANVTDLQSRAFAAHEAAEALYRMGRSYTPTERDLPVISPPPGVLG